MLPDLPDLKKDIDEILHLYLRNQVNKKLGFFNEVPKQIIHEGDKLKITRADGSVEVSALERASAEMSLDLADIPRLTLQEKIIKINDVADKMALQISKHLYGSLNKTLEEAGQSSDNKGRPLDAEVIFSTLEKIQLEFDDFGKLELSIVVSPELLPKAEQILEQIKSDPHLRKRYDEIIMRKRIEWRDREAARKLVG